MINVSQHKLAEICRAAVRTTRKHTTVITVPIFWEGVQGTLFVKVAAEAKTELVRLR